MDEAPGNRARWIVLAVVGAALIAAALIYIFWRAAPSAAPPAVAVDAAARRQPDRRSPDAAAPREPPPPPKKVTRQPTRQLSDRELRDAQRRAVPLLRSCGQRQRLSETRRVTVLIQLAGGGRVGSVTVDAGGDLALAGCVRRMVASWRFPSDLKAQKIVFPVILGGAD